MIFRSEKKNVYFHRSAIDEKEFVELNSAKIILDGINKFY